jgi:hypothetical protein
MVILVPVIAGDSTIPKWVLECVTASRDRKGMSKAFLERCAFSLLPTGFILLIRFPQMSSQEIVQAITNPWTFAFLLALLVWAIMVVLPVIRAQKWLDNHQKWSEVALLEWQELPKSPRFINSFASQVKGETSIPKWVLSRLTSSLDRKGLSLEIRRLWVLLVIFGLLLLLPWVAVVFLLVFSQLDVWLAITILSPSLLWWLGFWQVSMGQRAKTWLDRNEKWAEVATLEWIGYKPARNENLRIVLVLSCPFIFLGFYMWFFGPPK